MRDSRVPHPAFRVNPVVRMPIPYAGFVQPNP